MKKFHLKINYFHGRYFSLGSFKEEYLDLNLNHVCQVRHNESCGHKSLFKRHYKEVLL